MKLNHFFRVNWVLQLLVGIGLFTVSFIIEYEILSTFLESSILALILAIALELGKAVAIVWHRYMSYQTTNNYPAITQLTSNAFRIGLVVFSLICSLLFMSQHFDRPHKETIRSGEISDAKSVFNNTLIEIDAIHQQKRADLKSKQNREYEDLKDFHNLRITKLENEIDIEMDNSVRGHFKGPRYTEFELRLAQEKVAMKTALEDQSKRFFNEMETWAKNSTAELSRLRKEARSEHDQKYEMILNKSYDSDERAHDPIIIAFINLMESVLNTGIEPLQFVFIFSILLCVLMELGIILAFDTVTLSVLPALTKQQHSKQQSETYKGEVVGEVSRESSHQASVLRTIK